MSAATQITGRLAKMVQRRNREFASDAALKALLGIVFSAVTFGVIFWMAWVAGFLFGHFLSMHGWQFGLIVSGLFFVVATLSAWQRVDPLAGLEPLTEPQMVATLISQAAGGLGLFSPRHAIAGAAIVLIGGPANVFGALGIWAHRIRADQTLIEQAARLLVSSHGELPIEDVREPAAALLLRRLALIKILPKGDSAALALTDNGFTVLGAGKPGKGKRTAGKAKQTDT